MAGLYELEQRVKKNLTLVRPKITEQDVKDATEWATEASKYIGSLSIETINRLKANLDKYNAMYIQAVGKCAINNKMDESLNTPADATHIQYNNIVHGALKQLTERLALALF